MTTSEQILEVAYDLFLKKGYAGTSLRQIAAASNTNLGLIPYHFENKAKLAAEAHKKMMAHLYAKIDFDLIELNNPIESYYYGYVMLQYYILLNPNVAKFYMECLEKVDSYLPPSPQTVISAEEISKAYNKDASLDVIQCYTSGIERALFIRKRNGLLQMNYFDINATIIEIVLSYLGIEKAIYKQAFRNVNERVLSLPYNWALLN